MSQVTIQDILSSDNVSASRATIMSNFRTLADSVNKMQLLLDVNQNGGALTVGGLTLQRKANPTSAFILNVEASGSIAGRLTINQNLVVGTSNNLESVFNERLSVIGEFKTVGKTVIEGPIKVGSGAISDITPIQNSFVTLTFPSSGLVSLSPGIEGQVVIIKIVSSNALGIDSGSPLQRIADLTGMSTPGATEKTFLTCLFINGVWRVINSVAPNNVTITIP